MTREEIIAAIDEEIARLEKVRELLQAAGSSKFAGSIGRKSVSAPKKRNLSADARARIAAAQKRRWAKQKAAQGNNKKQGS
jgi:hypothetical protein